MTKIKNVRLLNHLGILSNCNRGSWVPKKAKKSAHLVWRKSAHF